MAISNESTAPLPGFSKLPDRVRSSAPSVSLANFNEYVSGLVSVNENFAPAAVALGARDDSNEASPSVTVQLPPTSELSIARCALANTSRRFLTGEVVDPATYGPPPVFSLKRIPAGANTCGNNSGLSKSTLIVCPTDSGVTKLRV